MASSEAGQKRTSGARVVEIALSFEPSAAQRARIEAFGRYRVLTREVLERDPAALADVEVLVTQHLDPDVVARARSLRWVQTYGAGVEWLLTESVRARDDLTITNARGIHAQPIAEHVFGLLLAFTRRIDRSILQQHEGVWKPKHLIDELRTIEGATLGILGLGAIGRRIAQLGRAFGMRVVGNRRSGESVAAVDRLYGPNDLHALLADSDYLVNALPLTPDTRGLLGREALAKLKPDAVLINIGRGATVDTDALVTALKENKLGGALLDVTDPEPLPAGHALWKLPNVIITPHYSGAHPGYADHVGEIFLENLRRYLAGEALVNLVDKHAGY